MEAQPTNGLTVWEAKERAWLAAIETDEWRDKRRIAEDPNATADVLHGLLDQLDQVEEMRNHSLIVAMAVHPNTSPDDLLRLLAMGWPRCNRAMFQNPILPFLPLEMPDFWQRVSVRACEVLLGDETTPVSIINQLLHHPAESVVRDARLHITLAWQLQTCDEAREAITDYWQSYCTAESQISDWTINETWHAEIVELGLAPAWAVGQGNAVSTPTAPPMSDVARQWYDIKGNGKEAEAARMELWRKCVGALDGPLEASGARMGKIGFAITNWLGRRLVRALSPNARDFGLEYAVGSATDDDRQLEIAVEHPNVTPSVLRSIVQEKPDIHVRLRLAAHPMTPPDVLQKLLSKEEQKGERSYVILRRLARRHPNVPSQTAEQAAQSFAASVGQYHTRLTEFVRFVANLHGAYDDKVLFDKGQWTRWSSRLDAALKLPLSAVPSKQDKCERSPLDLMHHLAHDGNRLVRWAAKTRLADPDFNFTWHEEDE